MERRFIKQASASVKIETRADGKPMVCGYAAVFYNSADPGTEYQLWGASGRYPRAVERIMPGAFDRAIKEDDCRALFNHDASLLLGRTGAGTCRLSVDAKGLRFEIDPADTQVCRDVCEHVKRGDLTGCSLSFLPSTQRWTNSEDPDVREILSVDPLYDIGPATFPAYRATSVGCRSVGGEDEARKSHEAWIAERGKTAAAILGYRARALEVSI